nr:hypothetical protein [Tanacetum cinerariifolium]
MIAILEKYDLNIDFHQIVDFVEASHLRYALTFNPTVYVSHIRQFWSTARIETTKEGTKILAIVDGKLRTISESSIRRNLKLKDEAGISSLPDAELFENLTLMRYNILPNQKFTFQKGQFSHQWKNLIHTIMQCSYEHASPIEDDSQDIPIKGRSLDEGEEASAERSTKRGSDDTEEMVNVLTSLDAAKILTSGGVQVSISPAVEFATATVSIPTGSGSIPTASLPGIEVPTGSGFVPTTSPIFTTAIVATPYTRRKGKEKMVESYTPKKKKLQEHIYIQVAREMEEQMALVKETLNIRLATNDKEKELWVELNRLYEPYFEDLLWTHTQNMMHALVEWKIYDTCRVYHVISKDQEMFMLVEKDYPLKKGLAIVMISYKLQGKIVGNKMHKAFPLLLRSSHCQKKFPLLVKKVSPAEEKRCTAKRIALLVKTG